LTTIRKHIVGIAEKTVLSGAAVVTHYAEAFGGNRVITSYNLHNNQIRRFSDALADVFRFLMKMVQRTGLLSPIMHVIVASGIASIIWMGGYLMAHDQLSPGGFVSFITAVLLLYQPIKSIGNDINAVNMSLLAMERVFELLKDKPAIVNGPNPIKLTAVKSRVEYRDVCFEYVKNKPVLKNVNLTVNVGQTIALVGNSGGGKSTFVNLLPRFYDVKSGSILIDGVDIRDLDLDSLRDNIAVVFQDNFLFSGTIQDNIMVGNEKATKKQLNQAIRSACLEEFVENLDKKLDTEIGERGILLSGGQKQRIAIARAFIKDAPIVVLDEATSSLDNKSEAVVQQAIENLMRDRTVFVVAHRLSTVKNADRIIVINHGKIVETGTHNELISKNNSVYASLYNTQIK
jgi:subfamily B ATP-binding cassette protein MsbA